MVEVRVRLASKAECIRDAIAVVNDVDVHSERHGDMGSEECEECEECPSVS